jgi:hypothetical protein
LGRRPRRLRRRGGRGGRGVGAVAAVAASRGRGVARSRRRAVAAAYASIVDGLPDAFTREDFALVAKDHRDRGPLLLRLDGKDHRSLLGNRFVPKRVS